MQIPVATFLVCHGTLSLRLAGLVAITSGLIGGGVWLVDVADRSDGDGLRVGFWRNPFMQFPPFNEAFLDLSMWLLLICSAATVLGGLMLLVPCKWGARLVTWQARISIMTNSVIAFFIVAATFVFAQNQWDQWYLAGSSKALLLRLGSIAVDLMLWTFLSSKAVSGFFVRQSRAPQRAFDVIIRSPVDRGEGGMTLPLTETTQG